MYLLYLDDSGSIDDPNTRFFVLGGICIFERQTHWLDARLTEIAARFDPSCPESVELHAGVMRGGNDGWDRFAPTDRVQATVDVLSLLADPHLKVKAFASVIEKSLLPRNEIIPKAFEHLATCFDNYLAARYRVKDPQRGIVIFDNAFFEQSIQNLSYAFKHIGHAAGRLRNFAEVPLFIDSRASRLIQMADFVAYWIFRRYQSMDDRGFKLIEPYLHKYGGQVHGLFEIVSPTHLQQMSAPAPSNVPFPAYSGTGVILPAAVPVK